MGSLIKYASRSKNGEGGLYWSKATDDGAPFRGARPPLLTQDEYETKVEKVSDAQVDIFDLSDEAQKQRYKEILDATLTGWYRIIFRDHQYDATRGTWRVLVEWAENYMELKR